MHFVGGLCFLNAFSHHHYRGPPPSRREVNKPPHLKLIKFVALLQSLCYNEENKWIGGVNMSLSYNKKNIPLAKTLRKNATSQENHLWYCFLSNYEVRFQRQKAIDNFIADFYCHRAKLIIEIDGSQHYTEQGIKRDEFRTEILEGYDLKVIRLTNHQIDTRFADVCHYIDGVVKSSLES